MTAANHIDEMLGEEPVIPETTEETPVVEPVVEQPVEEVEQVVEAKEEPKTDELVENYKRMAHAERMERKQLQEQLALTQQRFEALMAAAQPRQESPPEYDDDPLGSTHAKVEGVAKAIEELKAAEANRQQAAQFQGYVQSVQQAEQAFAEKTPDYKEAVTFLQTRRMNELQMMGYDADTAMKVLAQDAFALSQRAQQIGESPAEFVYKLAKTSGYSPKMPSSSANLDTIAAGQQVAKSVAGGANPVAEGGLPPNLADLSDDEFEALFKKMVK